MLVFDNHHIIKTDGKTTEQIVDMRFKEYEIRQAKEREERMAREAELQANKKEITAPVAKEEPKAKAELATVPHPSAIGRAIAKLRNTLHI